MARINVEESIWRDERFHKLSAELGKATALGTLVIAWDLAQKWWGKSPHNTIPLSEWESEPLLKKLNDYGLAKITDCGVIVSGSEKACAFKIRQASNGKLGGLKSKRNFLSQISQTSQTEPDKPSSSSSSSKERTPIVPKGDVLLLVEIFNQEGEGKLAACHKVTPSVVKAAKVALDLDPNLDNWRKVFRHIAKQDWANGGKGGNKQGFFVCIRQQHYETAMASQVRPKGSLDHLLGEFKGEEQS